MPPSTCCRKAKTSAGALLMKVCILSTKCSKWKAALNSTLSVNLRWVWWKHSRCIFFPGITCFVNTFHGSFKSCIYSNKFQPPKKRWGFHHLRSKETQGNKRTRPERVLNSTFVLLELRLLYIFSNGWGEMTVSVWFLFLEPVFSLESPQTQIKCQVANFGIFGWGVSFNSD